MARLKHKFTIEQMKDFEKRLNEIQYNATHGEIRSTANEEELKLLNTIDFLCRMSGMLADIIKQELEGHIETHDPYGYSDNRLRLAQSSMKYYLKDKDITFN